MVILDHHGVGRVYADPAHFLTAPDRDPGVGRIGALQPFLAWRRDRAQIAADIGGGQAKTANAADHHMGEVLTDPATLGKGERWGGGDIGRLGVIDEIIVDATRELERRVENRPIGQKALSRIIRDLGAERRARGRKQKGSRAGGAKIRHGEAFVMELAG